MVSAATRLELRCVHQHTPYVLRHLTCGCCLPTQYQIEGIFFASVVRQQYDGTTEKPFWVSLLLNKTSSPLPTCCSSFNKKKTISPSITTRSFCERLQDVCNINFSRGTTSAAVSPGREKLWSTLRSSSFTLSSTLSTGKIPITVYA